jgi:hypothetical protein
VTYTLDWPVTYTLALETLETVRRAGRACLPESPISSLCQESQCESEDVIIPLPLIIFNLIKWNVGTHGHMNTHIHAPHLQKQPADGRNPAALPPL